MAANPNGFALSGKLGHLADCPVRGLFFRSVDSSTCLKSYYEAVRVMCGKCAGTGYKTSLNQPKTKGLSSMFSRLYEWLASVTGSIRATCSHSPYSSVLRRHC